MSFDDPDTSRSCVSGERRGPNEGGYLYLYAENAAGYARNERLTLIVDDE